MNLKITFSILALFTVHTGQTYASKKQEKQQIETKQHAMTNRRISNMVKYLKRRTQKFEEFDIEKELPSTLAKWDTGEIKAKDLRKLCGFDIYDSFIYNLPRLQEQERKEKITSFIRSQCEFIFLANTNPESFKKIPYERPAETLKRYIKKEFFSKATIADPQKALMSLEKELKGKINYELSMQELVALYKNQRRDQFVNDLRNKRMSTHNFSLFKLESHSED